MRFVNNLLDGPIYLCSNGIDDNEHFFIHCPLYYTNHIKLINTVNQVGVFTILYWDANLDVDQNCIIVKAVHDFILDSGCFLFSVTCI